MLPGSKAVLWDLDGVLIDSGRLHYITWQKILEEAGFPFTEEDFKATFGRNNHGVLTHVLGHPPTEEFLADTAERKEALFREILPGKLTVLPGVLHWLAWFRDQGFKQAVASSAPPQNIEVMIDDVGIRPYFDYLAAGGYLASKPDPAVFLLAARELGVEPANCLVIEDSHAGVEGAKRGGMKCIAVETTHSARSLDGADAIVHRLTDLTPEIIDGLFSKIR